MAGPKKRPAVERFLSNVEKQADGCWIYGTNQRYGMILRDDGKPQSAHKFSYELHKGEVPTGLYVCHTCDVKQCVNPDHLYAGTHEDNTRDIIERGRTAKNSGRVVKTKPVKRYRQGRALSKENRERLRAEYASGKFTQMQLAARYRVSQGTVSATIRRAKNMATAPAKRFTGNYRRKLSPENLRQIVTLYESGKTQAEIASQFGCSQAHVSRIILKSKGTSP